MGNASIDRRRFLAAAITFSGIGLCPALLRHGAAWAQSAAAPTPAMVRMARLLIPYDALDDSVYAEVLGTAMTLMAGAHPLAQSLAEAEAALDDRQSGDFTALDDAAQLAALTALQDAGFFAPVLSALKLFFFGHPATFAVMNYEGPSWQQGGYLGRGAGEIDWLPEAE